MPLTCIVVNCGSRADRDQVCFFAVPKISHFKHATHLNELSTQRRQKWINAIKRADLTESILKYEKVCRKPSDLQEVNSPDWVPTQNMGYTAGSQLKRKGDLERVERIHKRRKIDTKMQRIDIHENVKESEIEDLIPTEIPTHDQIETCVETQTFLTGKDLDNQSEQLTFATKKVEETLKKYRRTQLTYTELENDNVKCRYYTGLDFKIFKLVFEDIKGFISTTAVSALEPSQQLLLTCMKLRLNLPFKYLGYRFGISQTTCSSYFNLITDILYQRYKYFIIWPNRDNSALNVPQCFKEVFHDKTTVIIDCFEVFIEKPSSYVTQQQSWSNYKHHNTIKFLIGITPQGSISYISDAWGGRTSDKQIVQLSGFLNNIHPQDIVLADRGFAIKESLAILQAKLVIPAFTKQKAQLIPIEIEETRNIAHVRVHVERIIGSIKSIFAIFKGPIPISMLTHTMNDVNILDKIVIACCAFINMCTPIIPM